MYVDEQLLLHFMSSTLLIGVPATVIIRYDKHEKSGGVQTNNLMQVEMLPPQEICCWTAVNAKVKRLGQ